MKGNCQTALAEAAELSQDPSWTYSASTSPQLSTLETLRLIRDQRDAPPSEGVPAGMRRAPGPKDGSAILEAEIQRRDPGRDLSGEPPTDTELAEFAASIDHSLNEFSTAGPLQQLRWGQGFCDSRSRIIDRLVAHYPEGANLVLTPAWVDYSRWLGIDADNWREPSPLADQIKVSAALTRAWARGRSGRKVLVSGFAPFDPARCFMPGTHDGDTVATIDAALAAGEVIGVKLYPPMGSRPQATTACGGPISPSR